VFFSAASQLVYQIEQSLKWEYRLLSKDERTIVISLYIYFIRPLPKEENQTDLYSYVLVCYCFLTLYLVAIFDVIRTLCDSTPTTIFRL
jgi:hypothetical protein